MPVNKPYHVEACVTNVEQALYAASHGAHRIELCVRLETEGMSPARALLQQVLEAVDIPVRVMIRETETGFEADDIILQKMISRISEFHDMPLDGFVIGIVKNNAIDRPAMQRLIDVCKPHHITFHKAIDLTDHIESEIEFLNTCETIDTILTSGNAVRAADGVHQILKIKSMFQGHVMAAGKILKADLPSLHERLGLNWYHGRAIV
jgi:copper homeostasis protein